MKSKHDLILSALFCLAVGLFLGWAFLHAIAYELY